MKKEFIVMVVGGVLLLLFWKRRPIINAIKNITDMQLSKNFWLREYLVTNTGLPNEPTESEIKNIQNLNTNVMQPIRDLLNTPIIINSGFRSLAVNNAIGGAANSQHRIGSAADFRTPNFSLKTAYELIVRSNIPYDQIIFETKNSGSQWIHVSYARTHRRQALLANEVNGVMKYSPYTT